MATSDASGLGVFDASLIVVGSIVGAGIFLVSPYVAQDVRSPAAFLGVWLLGGIVSLSGALTSGELGGLFPRSGGEYVYLREAYGPGLGFLSGWTSFWIGFPGSIAALASGFGSAVAGMLGLSAAGAPKVIGLVAIAGLTLVNVFGLRSGRWTQNVLSATKLAAFAVLLGLGLLVRGSGWGGLVPFVAPGDAPGKIASGLVPALFAYSGWNAATYVTGEMRDPSRGLWRALAIGTGLCVVLYLAVNAAYLRALPLDELARTGEPAREAAVRLGGPAAAVLLGPLVAVCVLSSLQATILVGARIYYAMATDGLFFRPFGRLHASTGVPVVALAVQGVISAIELWTWQGSFDELLAFAMFAIVSFSILTGSAVFVLRVRRADAPRPFRVPGYPFVPGLFVAVSLWVLWSVFQYNAHETKIGLGLVATGIPAYLAFRRFNARRLQEPSR